MPHVAIDLNFLTHHKTLSTSPMAQLLFIRGLIYAATHLTDGFLPEAAINQLAYDLCRYQQTDKLMPGSTVPVTGPVVQIELVSELVSSKRWKKKRGGFVIHDYLEYQLSKREVEELRENKRKAGQAGGLASAAARAKASGQAESKQNQAPSPVPVPSQKKKNPEKMIVQSVDNGDRHTEGDGLTHVSGLQEQVLAAARKAGFEL